MAPSKLVVLPRMFPSRLVGNLMPKTVCRYDGMNVVSRSIDMHQPIIFVSMNYRWALTSVHFMDRRSDTSFPVFLVCL